MKTLYVLGGNGSNADLWQALQAHVRQFDLAPVELPGFGTNAELPCVGLDAWVAALLRQTAPGHALLACGVSAIVALQAARRAPGHFSRLILLAPVGAFLGERRFPALMRLPGVARLARWVLGHAPGLLRRPFRDLDAGQLRLLAGGYRQCRAFVPFFRDIRAETALDQLEWLEGDIDLVWGARDGVQRVAYAAAWSAILARARLHVHLHPQWGHYPYLSDTRDFADWLDEHSTGCYGGAIADGPALLRAHSKAGRLHLAMLAGLPVPPFFVLRPGDLLPPLAPGFYAVRSSAEDEDGADCSNAGRSTSFVRVAAADVALHVQALLQVGVAEVVVQVFVEPQVSGVAFVRHLGAEIDWVHGHLQRLVEGVSDPQHLCLSRLGGAHGARPEVQTLAAGLEALALWGFLQQAIRCFHYMHADIEWAWDGQQLWLLQIRPVTDYGWRRYLTSANIEEILPARPSRLMETAQRRAAGSIWRCLAPWDSAVLRDAESFTARWNNASYINLDGLLARLGSWGLPASRVTGEIGGLAPELPWRALHLLRSLPVFIGLHFGSRAHLDQLGQHLQNWHEELRAVPNEAELLAAWFSRCYVDIVRGNLMLAFAIGSAGGGLAGADSGIYGGLDEASLHRLPFETDPATPRVPGAVTELLPVPRWPWPIRVMHRLGLPGMAPYYRSLREWYRDNLMRIFYELHQRMRATEGAEAWLAPHVGERTRHGGFWQSGEADGQAGGVLLLCPGLAEGVLGQHILLENALDPGRWQQYRAARAVIARCGGRLSHGATLLRELRVPSAVIPEVNPAWIGYRVRLDNGVLTLMEVP